MKPAVLPHGAWEAMLPRAIATLDYAPSFEHCVAMTGDFLDRL